MQPPEHKWTMVVDLDRCTGCTACMVACHAENNVGNVSINDVLDRHANHWIRIERYWTVKDRQTRGILLPIMCQQCRRASCEPVCPVYATFHSKQQNINVQAYQRCVGTRYCQNNDPYKVRFFNWFAPDFAPPLNQQLNPDVTVRSAGVIEKCTFCIQRINRAEQKASRDGRTVQDGEIVPACVQTCPSSALIFGDLYDPNSHVSQVVAGNQGRSFHLLEELGTEPAVVYLKGGELHGGQ